jgi:hypothetical protein
VIVVERVDRIADAVRVGRRALSIARRSTLSRHAREEARAP